MAQVAFIADTSVFARLHQPAVVAEFAPLVATGKIAMCPPVAFELGYAARSRDDFDALTSRLSSFPWLVVTDADHRVGCAQGISRLIR